MTSPRAKGSERERLCMEQLKAHIGRNQKYIIVGEWKSRMQKFGDQDFWNAFDLALALRYGNIILPYFVQVKSEYSPKFFKAYREQWKDIMGHVYLAIWHPSDKLRRKYSGGINIKLKDFLLIRV